MLPVLTGSIALRFGCLACSCIGGSTSKKQTSFHALRTEVGWVLSINSSGYAQIFCVEWHRIPCALHDDPFSELAEISPAKERIMRAAVPAYKKSRTEHRHQPYLSAGVKTTTISVTSSATAAMTGCSSNVSSVKQSRRDMLTTVINCPVAIRRKEGCCH